MNSKGQIGILTYFTMLFFFIAFWALFLAGWIAGIGARAVSTNNLTGFEAFAFANLNLWVFLGVLLAGAIGVFAARGGGTAA